MACFCSVGFSRRALACVVFVTLVLSSASGYDSNVAFFDGKCFCEHVCIHIDNGFMCKCHPGFHLAHDGFSCLESANTVVSSRQISSNSIDHPVVSIQDTAEVQDVLSDTGDSTRLSNHVSPKKTDANKLSLQTHSLQPEKRPPVVNSNSNFSSHDLIKNDNGHPIRKEVFLEPLPLVQNPSCHDTGCENNGTCVRRGTVAKCSCPLGFGGSRCQKVVSVKYPKFHGDGYFALPVLKDGYKEFDIYIEFKPRSKDGLLLFSAEREDGRTDFFSLALINGLVEYRFDCGTGHSTIRSSNEVKLGRWNTVRAQRVNNQGFLWLNGIGPVSGYSKGAYSRITLRLHLYLGGYSNVSAISQRTGTAQGFIGCIQDIRINARRYDMRSVENEGDGQHGSNVGECSEGVCDGVSCQNGGTCVARSADSHVCLCPLGTGGELCQTVSKVHIPKFSGFSLLRYRGLGRSSLSFTEIEMVFKPTQPEGLMLYNGYRRDGKGDFISIAMRDRHLEFQFDLGTGPGVIRSLRPLTLDQWHRVKVSRTGMQGVVEVDQQPMMLGMARGAFTQMTLTQDLIVGGHHDFTQTSKVANLSKSFNGCIQKIIINDKPLRLLEDADSGVNIDACDHPCIGEPCMNSGLCVPDKDVYTCSCPLGFMGTNCDTEIKEVIGIPMFSGNSYLMYGNTEVNKRLNGRVNDVQVRLKTESPNGLIFWSGQNQPMLPSSDYLALGFHDGALQFRYNLGGGDVIISYNDTRLWDGRWHFIRVQRDKHDGYLEVDRSMIVEGNSPVGYTVLNTNTVLYIGGIPDPIHNTFRKYTTGFSGCINEVTLSEDYKLSLMQEARDGRSIQPCNIT